MAALQNLPTGMQECGLQATILFDNLTSIFVVKKLPAFYGIQNVITLFT
jgi:hypothetical protein